MKVRRALSLPQKPASDRKRSVFLNLPYDADYADALLAYVAAASALGLKAHATLEITQSTRRLERIQSLVEDCMYSIHDLSHCTIDSRSKVPRFNMPFELGLAVAIDPKSKAHEWSVFERKRYRLNKSLSDLDGTDPHIYGGKPNGIFREMMSIFANSNHRVQVDDMRKIYRALKRELPAVQKRAGTKSVFSASVFVPLKAKAAGLAYALQASKRNTTTLRREVNRLVRSSSRH